MRILMLGNSFTTKNDLPSLLAQLTQSEVVAHARGGARLSEHLNPNTKMGERTQEALQTEKWNYVVLQEMSNAPIKSKEKFLSAVEKLCEQIRENGAEPVLFATWAYEQDSKQLKKLSMDHDEMDKKMFEAYHEAAKINDCLIANVGKAFYENSKSIDLYAEDGCHPNEQGSELAANMIASVILDHHTNK